MIYRLQYSVDIKEIGISNQVQEIVKDGKFKYLASNSFRSAPDEGPISFDIQFPVFKMEKRAKRLDFVWCAPLSYPFRLFSKKVISVIEEVKVPDYDTFPVKIIDKGKIYNYIVFRLRYKQGYINWQDSTFVIIDKTKKKIKDGQFVTPEIQSIQLNSYEEYFLQMRAFFKDKSNLRVLPKLVKFTPDIHEYDLFRILSPAPIDLYCSEKFKTAIEANNLTGFRFTPIDLKGLIYPRGRSIIV